ncbi:MAG TPA: PcfJ domain-containing protein [Xanthobacteraceae bacterium]|nr:PcfJ domain-containing protein [Xanthobacteraceae bacterium]
MGKRNRWREDRRREAERRISAVLEASSRTDAHPAAPECFADFKPELREKIASLRGYALRAPEDWRCRIKSRSQERRFIDLVRFTFARFRVAAHLEQAWIEECDDDFVDKLIPPDRRAGRRKGAPDLRRWYLAAAQGGSLYRQEASTYLSRQETHHFLTAPREIASMRQAFWYAVARAHCDRVDVALRIARCKVSSYSIASTFWKEVARFFARNPLAGDGMDDLADFLFTAKRDDPAFTLKGRTLAVLRRRMDEWHRALRRKQAVGGGAWTGSPLPDVDYESGSRDKRAIWRIRQIRTGKELFAEGMRMHHCVAGYKPQCMSGDISIWSMTCEFPIGRMHKGVTMEVTREGRIVQCRGFANRLPQANEVATVKRWAGDHGMTWASLEG